MKYLSDIIYIQNIIYLYKNEYVIYDIDLSKIFNINISKLIKKYNLENICIKIKNKYLFTKDAILFLSIILNSNKYNKVIISILNSINTLEIKNDIYYLNKIKLYKKIV